MHEQEGSVVPMRCMDHSTISPSRPTLSTVVSSEQKRTLYTNIIDSSKANQTEKVLVNSMDTWPLDLHEQANPLLVKQLPYRIRVPIHIRQSNNNQFDMMS
jgi:hypothetical protein